MRHWAENKLKKTISLLAGTIAFTVIVTLPVSYFYVQYRNLSEDLQHIADIISGDISAYVFQNPNTWSYNETRLSGYLEKNIKIDKEQAILFSKEQDINIRAGIIERRPIMTRQAKINDGINIVATVEVQGSLYPSIIGALFALILSSFLGVMIYIVLYFWPLKALRFAFSQLNETNKELENEIIVKRELLEKADELTKKLHNMAMHDALTELPNRHLFMDRLEQAIKLAHREQTLLAVFFLDLDNFKGINDSLGHAIGDQVLISVARRLQSCIREVDTISRLGGDEYSLIISSLHLSQHIDEMAKKLLNELKRPMLIDGHELYVSSSIGISIYPDDGETPGTLLRNADAAMYKAKEEGRNNYRYYTEDMTKRAFERVLMESNLRRAIEHEEFILYYQPQYDARTDKLIGMEVLVRWDHPEVGLVPPSKFIPVAEETGLIVQLDRWVFKAALNQLNIWYQLGYQPGKLSLNLAMKQLYQEDFMFFIHETLAKTGCQPQWLEFELTESQIMQKPEHAIAILQQISKLGIDIAVDDFGTGYSSLTYLKRLPVNKLKIDQSFVHDVPDDDEDVAIVQAIIALAKSMRLNVIAEGVEKKNQKAFLLEHDCNLIQGFLYGKPMQAEDIEKLFALKEAVLSKQIK